MVEQTEQNQTQDQNGASAKKNDILGFILEKHKALIDSHYYARDELCFVVTPAHLVAFLKFMKDDPRCQYSQLLDICGVDYPDRPQRFEVVYQLLSMVHNRRVIVKVKLAEGVSLPSVTSLYSTAGWFEREAWDMYGICFDDNPDLRRILTDYGFDGHPLRKDFPLTGYTEVRYDNEQKRVVYEPVKLRQDFRSFDFMSPWEGMTDRIVQDYHLPGDEKATEIDSDVLKKVQG